MKEINWPDNKEFAFSIVDDTDNAFIENIKPVYDLLIKQNLKTTKTIWLYNSRDHFSGDSMENVEYQDFIFDLINHGFEIGLHNVGSGDFKREEIIQGIELFNNILGYYPKIHINHSSNRDNLYWGHKRYGLILNALIKMVYGEKRNYSGDEPTSEYFWGDYSKKYVKYIRNRVFNGINTLKYDGRMPYKEKSKVYSNYWFSSSDGHTIEEFNALISQTKY